MRLVELECPNCGGRMEEIDSTHVKCVYCEKVYMIADLIVDDSEENQKEEEKLSIAQETAKKLKKQSQIKQTQAKQPSGCLMVAQTYLVFFFITLIGVVIVLALNFAGDAIKDGIGKLFAEEETYTEIGTEAFTVTPGKNLSSAIWYSDEMTPMEVVFSGMVEKIYEKDYYDMTLEDWGSLTSLTIDGNDDGKIDVIAIVNGEERCITCEGSVGEALTFTWAFRNIEELNADFTIEARDITGLTKLTKIQCENYLSDLIELLPYPENVTEITGVRISGKIEGAEKLTNLKVLEAEIYRCENVAALGELKSLEEIDISSSDDLKSFDMLGNLQNLRSVKIDSDALYSIEFVKNLNNLETLEIDGGELKSIEALKNKQGLKRLVIENCYTIQDYDIIAALPDLEELVVVGTWVRESIKWDNLKKLKSLSITDADYTNIMKELPKLSALEELSLSSVGEDILSIGELSNLKRLTLTGTSDIDVSVLYNLSNLEEIRFNSVYRAKGLEAVFGLPKLKKLDLGYSGFEMDFDKVAESITLEWLVIKNCTFDGEVLKDNMNIFERFPELKVVGINGAELNNVEFVKYLPKLEQLDIIDNYVADVTPLRDCKNLKELWCSQNAIVDEPVFAGDVVVHLR